MLSRLAANERVLLETCKQLTEAVAASHRMTPAGEWLLDNFYLVEEQIRTARRHLPKGYSRDLPRLADGPSAGLPRVYDIALETIAHGDGRVDPESLTRFVAAYQTVTPLMLGELWAIPIMLRLALIENLRRVALRVAAGRRDRDVAVAWANKLQEVVHQDPKSLILVLADMARSDPPMTTPFVSELARRLHGQGPALAMPLTWIEQQLAGSGLSTERLVRSGNQQQAADQVSISNSIGSMRLLGTMDWRDFVEAMSAVEQTLRTDPAMAYAAMDFATRDRYRHVVEAVARASGIPEAAVAGRAIGLALTAAARRGSADRAAHVGFYLIDQGLRDLERVTEARLDARARLRHAAGRAPLLLYLGTITLITLLLTGGLLAAARAEGVAGGALVPVGILALLATSQLAVATVNWLATLVASPHRLPRMDFSKGVPPESRTLVVVPSMLTSQRDIESLLESLEVAFLANRDGNVHFGLLTDLPDAAEETQAEDAPLLDAARRGIETLNLRYANGRHDSFFLLHRPRRWNPHDRIWMGYERKRGKLGDLNQLLRGGDASAFSMVEGNTAALTGVKYVITLDTDTQLPRDAAREFIGAMAHPLNRPVYDPDLGRVRAGYGILQPRVSASPLSRDPSRYGLLHAGVPGIDPYTRAVSDVYQDAFHEGSFIGKGIYDVDAFEQTLEGRFPENRILSHDLLEGCYARAGLLSDVQLYERYPTVYGADVKRRHRWIRGDWQLVPWLLPRVPGRPRMGPEHGALRAVALEAVRQPAQEPGAGDVDVAPGPGLDRVLLGVALDPDGARHPPDPTRAGRPGGPPAKAGRHAPGPAPRHRGPRRGAAVPPGRLRIGVPAPRGVLQSRRDPAHARASALHTPTAAGVASLRRPGTSVRHGLRRHGSLHGVRPGARRGHGDRRGRGRPAALIVAGPILFLWLASPVLAWWISLPLTRRRPRLTREQTRFLRRIARKTWAFFERCVGEEDHWLPPDNYQESRDPTVAHRTSPTNMGLALLANLSAYDFGYIPAGQLLERTTRALETMAGLARHRGHFYNWYDTRSLQPLRPGYVSTVDSGNLAGHLLTLRPGLIGLLDRPILESSWLDGLRDTLWVLEEGARDLPPAAMTRFREDLEAARSAPPDTLPAARLVFEELARAAEDVAAGLERGPESPAVGWAQALARQCRSATEEIDFLAPWAGLPDAVGGTGSLPGLQGIPTLRALARLDLAPPNPPDGQQEVRATPAQEVGTADRRRLVEQGSARAQARIVAIQRLSTRAGALADMDYDFLYDKASRLLSIGYNVDERRRDTSFYDLLASEARLCVFIAIAQGRLPQESWFALGRLLTTAGGEPLLLSWSGSMFEYLMPQLVMPTYASTLLGQTVRAAVARQIEYGRQRGVPWGVSESGYNTMDAHLNYQYRAFGVPGLGLKRGLGEDLVVAPYASVLALMVEPEAACMNLQELSSIGAEGQFGFLEAVDYTPARQRRGESHALVRSYMAHHQGMSLLALASALLDGRMQKRFESDPLFRATVPLLQERIPRASAFYAYTPERTGFQTGTDAPPMPIRVLDTPDTPNPEVQLLSNGRYHVMVTNAGGGYSKWNDLAVTRWREDGTRDPWGTFCYLRDVDSGATWTTAHQPSLAERRRLRGDLLGRASGIPSPRRSFRHPHRNRRLAGGRHRAPPGAHHQPFPRSPDRRDHELHGGGARGARRRRVASGVQQPLRADRDRG